MILPLESKRQARTKLRECIYMFYATERIITSLVMLVTLVSAINVPRGDDDDRSKHHFFWQPGHTFTRRACSFTRP